MHDLFLYLLELTPNWYVSIMGLAVLYIVISNVMRLPLYFMDSGKLTARLEARLEEIPSDISDFDRIMLTKRIREEEGGASRGVVMLLLFFLLKLIAPVTLAILFPVTLWNLLTSMSNPEPSLGEQSLMSAVGISAWLLFFMIFFTNLAGQRPLRAGANTSERTCYHSCHHYSLCHPSRVYTLGSALVLGDGNFGQDNDYFDLEEAAYCSEYLG